MRLPKDFVPRDYQIPLLRAMDSGYKRAIWIVHRRGGKDKTCINLLIKKSYERVGTYAYILPTYVMARNIIWRGMDKEGFRFIDHIPKELIAAKRDQDMEVELDNGSIIKLMGAEDPDRLRGINPIGVIFSEYAFMKPNVWDIIRPILTENEGWAVFNTTPNGKNHVFDTLEKARESDDWFTEVLTIAQTGVVSEEDVEKERQNGMSEEMIQQEFYCSFEIGAVGTLLGHQLAEAKKDGRVGFVPYLDHLPVETFWDLGRSDATAVWFLQRDRGRINYIDYYEMSGSTIEQDYKNIDQLGYNIKRVVLPHDARAKTKASLVSVEDQARNLWHSAEISVLPASSPIERVKKGRMMMKYCYFDETKCAEGLRRLENYKKRYNRVKQAYEEQPLHDENSHGADAFLYSADYWLETKPKEEQNVIADIYNDFSLREESAYSHLSPF